MRRRAPASAIQHTAPHIAQPAVPEEPKEPSRFALAGQRATDWVIFKVRTYRPERKSILLTSLVLLVLLKPFMMIGWSLVAAFALLLTFLFLGGDRFWRMVIVLFRAFARRNPSAARVVKLRAYVIARKWNRLMEWVPQGLADCISAPDLREMIAADARHEVALHDRLNRLNRDAAY